MTENFINADRFQSRLTKELRIKGSLSTPAPVLAPEIQPVIVVEGERPELLHLQREHRFSCTLTLGAVVNEFYYFQLNNPAGGHSLIVIEEFSVGGPTAAGSVDFGYADATVTASLGVRDSFCLDSRVPGRVPRQGVGEPIVGTDLANGLIEVFGRTAWAMGNVLARVQPNVVVTPGFGFSVQCTAVNEDLLGSCFWRERQAEDGELV